MYFCCKIHHILTLHSFKRSQKVNVLVYFCCKFHYTLTFQSFYLPRPQFSTKAAGLHVKKWRWDCGRLSHRVGARRLSGCKWYVCVCAFVCVFGCGCACVSLTGWVLERSPDVNGVCVCVCAWLCVCVCVCVCVRVCVCCACGSLYGVGSQSV